MLTAKVGGCEVRASKALKCKDFVFRCRDPHCPSPEMIVVAGERGHRIPHFRHKSNCGCRFAAGETEWHFEWKSHFDRIEVDMGIDSVTNEHNYADAVVRDRSGKDVVIEFQHSAISLKEQEDRERFYTSTGGMVWVHDARGKRDCDRFDKGIKFKAFDLKGNTLFGKNAFYLPAPDAYLPVDWIKRKVGVFFDFGPERDMLYIVAGRMANGDAVCMRFTKEEVIKSLQDNPSLFIYGVSDLIAMMNSMMRLRQMQQQQRLQPQQAHQQPVSRMVGRKFYSTGKPGVFQDQYGMKYIQRDGVAILLSSVSNTRSGFGRFQKKSSPYGGYKKRGPFGGGFKRKGR